MKNVYAKLFSLPAAMLFLMGTLSGCSVFDEDQNCAATYQVRFVYDMNMSGGDGFPSQVSSISLWVFDHETGDFVAKYSDSGEALSSNSYRMDISDLKPGNYDFIAWGGLEGSESFSVTSDVTAKEDLKCTMATVTKNGVATSSDLLTPLFYGSLDNQEFKDDNGEYLYTVYLMKDTNNINISLQHMSEESLLASDFTVYMVDANGNLNYNNALLPGSQIYYYPWSTGSGEIDMPGEDLNYVRVELSTCRLMADKNPVITILDNETGTTVYSIPIVEWAKKLRSMQNLSMTDQDYLDREHEYTIMLYLTDEESGWHAANIVINGFEMNE